MRWDTEAAVQRTTTTTGTQRVSVVFAVADASLALDLSVPPGAVVRDIAVALAGGEVDPSTSLFVDGKPCDPDQPVAETPLRRGSYLELRAHRDVVAREQPAVELRVTAGLEAGTRVELPAGTHRVGRTGDATVRLTSPTVSGVHATVEVSPTGAVSIADAGATNRTRVNGAFVTDAPPTPVPPGASIELGATILRVVPLDTSHRQSRAPGPFNRPPRTTAVSETAPIAGPARPITTPSSPRFSWTAITLPLVTGAALALLWDPRMAAFALFSPLLVVGNWWEERRRNRRQRADDGRSLTAAVDRFRDEVRAAIANEVALREDRAPDPAALVARVTSDDHRLWHRRPAHDDAFLVRLGNGGEPWRPRIADTGKLAVEAVAALEEEGHVRSAPITVRLDPGSVLGLAGPGAATRAVARSVVLQLTAQLGPADLRVALLVERETIDEWSGFRWLPHAAGVGEADGLALLAADGCAGRDTEAVVAALKAMPESTRLVVIAAPRIATGPHAPARPVLNGLCGPAIGVVISDAAEQLPASCTHVVEVDHDGVATLHEPASGRTVARILACGATVAAAGAAARAMAAVIDPEASDGAVALPANVRLFDIETEADADELAERWRASNTSVLRAVLGCTERGALDIDLVADGPHALVGGTTGAGKSELLRTLVASLASATGPDRLNIVLIDYKGGSAFDACAQLPHTVGVVTDLDDHLAERALRCLDAELRYRERRMRDARATDLIHYDRLRPTEPLPRLLVVIDEFATLAAELPDFVDALVGVAQRGRSLGVHLVLATQRPAGVVKDNIRANTNLRIALRMQDDADSNDIIGTTDAARIGRRQPGRAFARLGPGELIAFQAAIVSAPPPETTGAAVLVRPTPFGPNLHAAASRATTDAPSDLAHFAEAARRAAAQLALAPPRRPWPEPLPAMIDLVDLPAGAAGVVDEPSEQRTRPLALAAPSRNMLIYGTQGSGKTTALETVAVALARQFAPDRLHLYALDFGAGRLGSLMRLSHTGAAIGASEHDRQRRLIRTLRAELDKRRSAPNDNAPRIVLFIDGWAAFAAAFDDVEGMETRDQLTRIVADGPAVGIATVITADQPNAIPLALAGVVADKIALRLADRHDWSAFGMNSREAPPDLPGRGIDIGSGLEAQFAVASERAWTAVIDGPRVALDVGVLPSAVALDRVAASTRDGDAWTIDIAIAEDTLAPAGIRFHTGDHALISGPPRSGRSATLRAIAVAAASRADVETSIIALRPSPLRDVAGVTRKALTPDAVPDLTAAVREASCSQLVLVDDADLVDDGGQLASLIQSMAAGAHVVAAVRTDALRSGYGHWTRELRRSRLGIALAPQPEDGDLFGATFPRRMLPPNRPGCGLLVVDGRPVAVQVGL